MHIRQQIRNAVRDKIQGLGFASVHTNRVQNLQPEHLPAVIVITEDEDSEQTSKDGSLKREISVLVVVAIDGDTDTIDDDLDAWAEKIEPELRRVPPAKQIILTATALDFPPDEDGDRRFGYLVLEYMATALTD